MADKAISELTAATQVTPTDLFVLEQSGTAKKLTGQTLENWLVSLADGHGGIQSVDKTGTSGLVDTYTITLADTTTITFTVTNGKSITGNSKTSTSGLVDTYTITYNDGTSTKFTVTNGRGIKSWAKTGTSGLVDTYTITYDDGTIQTFTVTNGEKGDPGDTPHVFYKWASQEPTDASHSMGDVPDAWQGIYAGYEEEAPTDWTQYVWYKVKGDKGDTGAPATKVSDTVEYMASDSGQIIPSGSWSTTIPVVAQGRYLWTRVTTTFNTGDPVVSYSVARMGIDGSGSVSAVNDVSPDAYGNVQLKPDSIGALAFDGSNTMAGDLPMGGHKIVNLADPEDAADAATKGYTDTKADLPKTGSGTVISIDNALDEVLQSLRIYGKTTQDGTPTPESPVELVSVGGGGSITVSIGTSQEDESPQTMTISTPNGLPGIPVTSGGNYTDADGQQWICDEVDLQKGIYVQRVCVMTIAPTNITGLQSINSYGIANFTVKLTNAPKATEDYRMKAKCNRFVAQDSLISNTSEEGFLLSSTLVAYIRIKSETCSTIAEMKEYISNNPTQLAYIIETPVETALDSETIASYAALHTNRPNTTVYNDAGAYMDVGYYTPTATMLQADIAKELGKMLPKSGGIMTGPINMNGQSISGLNDPTGDTDAARKAYVDKMLPKTGGTMSGDIHMGGNKITGLGTPTEDGDAVPKSYATNKRTISVTAQVTMAVGATHTVSESIIDKPPIFASLAYANAVGKVVGTTGNWTITFNSFTNATGGVYLNFAGFNVSDDGLTLTLAYTTRLKLTSAGVNVESDISMVFGNVYVINT